MKIYSNNKIIDLANLFTMQINSLNELEQSVVQFARDWYSGKNNFILTTSGSTGNPKKIEVTRAQMEHSARQTGKALKLLNGDHSLICLNTQYIAGVMMLVRGFELDMTMTLVPPSSNPLTGFDTFTSFDFTALVPLQLQTILDTTPEKVPMLENMKAVIIGGAPVSASLAERIKPLKGNFFATYGMTETLSHIALKKLNGEDNSNEYVALEGVTLDRDHRGCLTISSPVTLNQTIVTNDVVELTSPTTFRWIGRADFIINSGGIKFSPELLEEKVSRVFIQMKIPNRFIICGRPDDLLGEKIVLIIEGSPISMDRQFELNKELAKVVLKFELPKEIHFFTTFPETQSGKLNRVQIMSMLSK